MTFGGNGPVSFGKFFEYFERYWYYCQQSGVRYNSLEVFLYTKNQYTRLREDWEKYTWDIEQLDQICYAIDNNHDMLDPSNFLNDEWAYVNHAKNCFYLCQ